MPHPGYLNLAGLRQFIFIIPGLISILACSLAQDSGQVEATVAAGVEATRQAEVNIQATVEAAVAATLQAGQITTPSTLSPTPVPTQSSQLSEAEQVRAVILAEVQAATNRDLALLQTLYAPGATVVNRNGTPADPEDDTRWQGWANIERRYLEFFSAGFTTAELANLSIRVNGHEAVGTHAGVIFDGTLYEDQGAYILEKLNGRWLITGLEYGNKSFQESLSGSVPGTPEPALYVLKVGQQHRYEEPWGWDRGDPCTAWETKNFDDTRPYYRGFNVELLLTNNSDKKVPDAWPVNFTTAAGKEVKACYYKYEGSGPAPGTTGSVTFFTVVDEGDYVETITLALEGQTVRLCLDGQGGWRSC